MAQKLIQGQKTVYNAMAKISGYAMLCAAVFACINVICRYIFNHSFNWAEEICTYVVVLCVFITFAWLETEDQQLCIDIVTSSVKNKKTLLVLYILRGIVTLVIISILIYFGWSSMLTAQKLGTATYVLKIPRYIMYAIVLVGYVCVWLGWLSVLLLNKGRKF